MLGISGMKNYPHLQLQLKNQSYVPMAPVPDFSCCVGFINLEIGKRRNLGILAFEKVSNLIYSHKWIIPISYMRPFNLQPLF